MKSQVSIFFVLLVLILATACQNKTKNKPNQPEAEPLSENFKNYWFSGEAEITSYHLKQARYGEHREGDAVLIFVTEEVLSEAQVKANQKTPSTVPVLKLNATKKFNTGIYPYSMMQSTFYPLSNNRHALKVSASIQEWCGHVYLQINNRNKFNVHLHSYFQGEADRSFALEKAVLENELWAQLRFDPQKITTGKTEIIPSLAYLRLKHKEVKAYDAEISQSTSKVEIITKIHYPELERNLEIHQANSFPFLITSWSETYPDGGKPLTTTAVKNKTLKTAYWKKNANKDLFLRKKLGLEH